MRVIEHPNIPMSVAKLLDAVSREPSVARIILFGSRALGDHEERSDVDIAIDAPKLNADRWRELRELADDWRTLYSLTFVRLQGMPERLRRRVLETGSVIYDASKIEGLARQP